MPVSQNPELECLDMKARALKQCRGCRHPLDQLELWYRSPLGARLAAVEAAVVGHMLDRLFGYHLVQVGAVSGFRDLAGESRIRHWILAAPSLTKGLPGAFTVALPDDLPIASDSVDAVLLPHTLELSADAHRVLREAERVLIPEGRIIVLGFNPMSLWGLRRLLPGSRRNVPWCGHFLAPHRVCDWLQLLGFDIEQQERLMFHPPWCSALSPRLSVGDNFGNQYLPIFGGGYAIRAVKRVSTLTPLRPRWAGRRAMLHGGAVEPSANRPHESAGGAEKQQVSRR